MLEVASVSPRNFREWWDWPVVGIFMQLMCRNKKVSMTEEGWSTVSLRPFYDNHLCVFIDLFLIAFFFLLPRVCRAPPVCVYVWLRVCVNAYVRVCVCVCVRCY